MGCTIERRTRQASTSVQTNNPSNNPPATKITLDTYPSVLRSRFTLKDFGSKRMRVDRERGLLQDQPHLPRVLLENCLQDRHIPAAVGALEVGVLHDCHRSIRRSADGSAGLDDGATRRREFARDALLHRLVGLRLGEMLIGVRGRLQRLHDLGRMLSDELGENFRMLLERGPQLVGRWGAGCQQRRERDQQRGAEA